VTGMGQAEARSTHVSAGHPACDLVAPLRLAAADAPAESRAVAGLASREEITTPPYSPRSPSSAGCGRSPASIFEQVNVTQDRRTEVDHVLVVASCWASSNREISALGVAGSWARGAERMSSDVDLVVLTTSPDSYIQSEEWLSDFGDPPVVRTQEWGGVLIERRVRLNSGLEIEFGFTRPAWAAVAPVDAGTRRVVSDGMRPLYDPVGLLAKLIAEVRGGR
jgi:hypothetical protein